ncbi:MAG: hypothetical protein RSA78_08165 [Oscillospiraceae bacterium]
MQITKFTTAERKGEPLPYSRHVTAFQSGSAVKHCNLGGTVGIIRSPRIFMG